MQVLQDLYCLYEGKNPSWQRFSLRHYHPEKRKNAWTRERLKIPNQTEFYGVALTNVDNQAIYMTGGSINNTNKCARYLIRHKSWQRSANLLSDRSYHSSCALKGMIYLIGGISPNPDFNNTIECLNARSEVQNYSLQ